MSNRQDTEESIENFVDNLQSLIDAKKLLDQILSYYNIYSGQFDKIPDYEIGFGSYSNQTLMQKIRSYKKFDDSE